MVMHRSFSWDTTVGNLKSAGVRGSWKEAEASHHVAGSDQQRPLVEVQTHPLKWRPRILEVSEP